MRPDPKAEALRWLSQAEYELAVAADLAGAGRAAAACFHSRQAVEVALKAVRFLHGERPSRVHDLSSTSGQLQAIVSFDPTFEKFREAAGRQDQYYLATRYPDVVPSGSTPFQLYSGEQAREALVSAREIVQHCRHTIEGQQQGQHP